MTMAWQCELTSNLGWAIFLDSSRNYDKANCSNPLRCLGDFGCIVSYNVTAMVTTITLRCLHMPSTAV